MFNIIASIIQSSNISRFEKSIAVLPFSNMSEEEGNAHLGDAITDEIISELQKIIGFDQVLSRSSTMQYKDNRPSISEMAKDLRVNYIIEGSIYRSGDNVGIRVKVIRAKNEDQVWANSYDGEWKDILFIQDNIAKEIAEGLKVVLSPEEIEQIEKRPTDNLEAYNFYLRGNDFYYSSYEQHNWRISIDMYKQAIELDSNFALAYTMLASSYLHLFWFHFDRSDEVLINSKEAIDAAFKIDPNLPEAYLALGHYYYWGFLNYSEALKQFETVLRFKPDNAECLYLIAAVNRRMGNWKEAEEGFLEAARNDPRSSRIASNTANTYYLMGEYSKSLYYSNIAISLSPDFPEAYREKIVLFLKWEGNTTNARKTLQEASSIINPSSNPRFIEIIVLLDIFDGQYQKAIDFLDTTNFEAVQVQFYYYPKALLYAMIYDLMKNKENAEHYYNLSRILLEDRILKYPDDSGLYGALGISLAGLSQKERAIQAGEKGVELIPVSKEAWKGVHRLGELAQIYVMVGEYELALEKLDYLLSIPGILSAKLLQLDPIWKPLWDHPGFTQLIEKYSDK